MDQSKEKNQTNNELVFQAAVSQAFKGISESMSEQEFQKILTILQSKKSTAQKLSKVFMNELNKSMNAAFEEICNEGSLTEGLAKASSLTEEATTVGYSDVWRPPGDVKLHLRSHDVEAIQSECQILEKQIFDIETKNAEKIAEITERRKKLHASQDQTTRLLNKSKFVVSNMQQVIDVMEEYIKNIDSTTNPKD